MAEYFISDLHFNHENLLTKIKGRDFYSTDYMNNYIIQKYNNIVRPNDTVWFLGDIGFGRRELLNDIIKKLNGKKYLITGNHDKLTYRSYIDMGFEQVFSRVELKRYGKSLLLCHYPWMPSPLKKFSYWLKVKDKPFPKYEDTKWLIHGHTHKTSGRSRLGPRSINVNLEYWNYTPVSLKQLISIIDKTGDTSCNTKMKSFLSKMLPKILKSKKRLKRKSLRKLLPSKRNLKRVVRKFRYRMQKL